MSFGWLQDYLPQRLKSMLFEIFSHSFGPFRTSPFKFFFIKTLILVFEENSALSHKNEIKIVNITHSVSSTGSLSLKTIERRKEASPRTEAEDG